MKAKQGEKTQSVMNVLLEQIRSGQLLKGSRIPSEYELARTYDVNKMIANKAVTCLVERGILTRGRGRAGTIVARTREYPVGAIAFVIVGPACGTFATHLLEGAEEAAFSRRYALQFLNWPNRQHEEEFWSLMTESPLLGLLSFGGSIPAGLPFPTLYVETRRSEGNGENWVVSDDFQGGYLVGKHLLSLGHRESAFVIGTHLSPSPGHRRAQGFMKALQERGIGNVSKRVVCMSPGSPHLPAVMDALSRTFPKLTAIAADRDAIAQQAVFHFQKKGLQVPRDISIAGYDMTMEYHRPMRITTIEQHPHHLAFHAANRLIDLIEGQCEAPIHDVLPVQLIVGETTAARRR